MHVFLFIINYLGCSSLTPFDRQLSHCWRSSLVPAGADLSSHQLSVFGAIYERRWSFRSDVVYRVVKSSGRQVYPCWINTSCCSVSDAVRVWFMTESMGYKVDLSEIGSEELNEIVFQNWHCIGQGFGVRYPLKRLRLRLLELNSLRRNRNRLQQQLPYYSGFWRLTDYDSATLVCSRLSDICHRIRYLK